MIQTIVISDDVKQKAKKVGSFLLDKLGDVIGICLLALIGIIFSIGQFLFGVFLWLIAAATFCWILCFVFIWLGHVFLGH